MYFYEQKGGKPLHWNYQKPFGEERDMWQVYREENLALRILILQTLDLSLSTEGILYILSLTFYTLPCFSSAAQFKTKFQGLEKGLRG